MTEKTKFIAAFISAQKEMGDAKKDSTNPYFKTKYADLNAVREAVIPNLNKHGIAVLQPIIQKDGKSFVRTILIHESGESLESDVEIVFSKANDAQAQGSGITYARRYGLQSIVNIGAEDDDGNKAANDSKPKDNIKKRLGDAADADMKETQEKAANQYFAKMKKDIEDCGSLAEMDALVERDKIKLNKLQKYHNNLYEMLIETVAEMKLNLTEE